MRRKDKEITNHSEIVSIIRQAHRCHLALCDGDTPYVVPVNYGYDRRSLYVHSAPHGKKIDLLRKNNTVGFSIETDIELLRSEIPCEISQKYRSIIGTGKAILIEEEPDKIKALDIIMRQHGYTGPFEYTPVQLAKVVIIKIEIETLTGKQAGF
jgi:nitroimidazol reductase NimA-like FMN-containing flavoprotein (pyridoxamine 5'-phosphate oxidase superfamily)